MRRGVAAWCLALAPAAPLGAQAPDLATQLVAAYSKLDSYCARARQVMSPGIAEIPPQVRELEHCALRDGRYKNVERTLQRVDTFWSDGEFNHYHLHPGIPGIRDTYGRVPAENMAAGVAPLLQVVLRWYGTPVVDEASLREHFAAFEPRPEASTASLVAYEARHADGGPGRRIWISREDGFIRRVGWGDSEVGAVTVIEIRTNQPVAAAQLAHEAPAAARLTHAVAKHLAEVAIALSALTFVVGIAFWRQRARGTAEEMAAARARGWRIYAHVAGWTVAAAVALTLFLPTGGDFTGAQILLNRIVWTLFYLYLLWLAGLFLLARHFTGSTPANVK